MYPIYQVFNQRGVIFFVLFFVGFFVLEKSQRRANQGQFSLLMEENRILAAGGTYLIEFIKALALVPHYNSLR